MVILESTNVSFLCAVRDEDAVVRLLIFDEGTSEKITILEPEGASPFLLPIDDLPIEDSPELRVELSFLLKRHYLH